MIISFSISALDSYLYQLEVNGIKYSIKAEDLKEEERSFAINAYLEKHDYKYTLHLKPHTTYNIEIKAQDESGFMEALLCGPKTPIQLSEEVKCSVDKNPIIVCYKSLSAYKFYWDRKSLSERFSLYGQLSQDVLETPYVDKPFDYVYRSGIAFHTNHGTTHAIRQAELSKHFTLLLKNRGTPPLAQVVQLFNDEETACLELAAFLFRSGRTNEYGWQQDNSYGVRSAQIFSHIAKELGFNEPLVTIIANCFDYHKESIVKTALPQQTLEMTQVKATLFKTILKASHECDLVRCETNSQKLVATMNETLQSMLNEQVPVSVVSEQFLHYAATLCRRTGAPITAKQFQLSTEEIRGNEHLAVVCANAPKKTLFQLQEVLPEHVFDVKPPTELWMGNTPRPTKDTKFYNWTAEQFASIPLEQCLKAERAHIHTHIPVYHATRRASYVLDLLCRELHQLKYGRNDIAWIRGTDIPPHGVKRTDLEFFKMPLELPQYDNSAYRSWHLLSCNPSLWQNTDRASEESTVDFFYSHVSVTNLNFSDLIHAALNHRGLLMGQTLLREELIKEFEALYNDPQYGELGVIYQYLIPHELVDQLAYISGDNGLPDAQHPSALQTLMRLKMGDTSLPNLRNFQVRLLVPKLLESNIAESLIVNNFHNINPMLEAQLVEKIKCLAKKAYEGPSDQIVVQKAKLTSQLEEPQVSRTSVLDSYTMRAPLTFFVPQKTPVKPQTDQQAATDSFDLFSDNFTLNLEDDDDIDHNIQSMGK